MRLYFFAIITCVTLNLRAQQVVFTENFNGGIPASWYLVNEDNLVPASSLSQFTNAWIPFVHLTDTVAASTSYYDPAGQAADYLITPRISIDTYSKIVWSARSYDASYPEYYLVLISTTDSLPASFTDTLMYVQEEFYYWKKRSVQLDLEGYANQDVFIAFKNITNDGYILMLDDVEMLSSDFAGLETESNFSYSVYPNPTNGNLNISLQGIGEIFTLYSADGREVLKTSDNRISVESMEAGLYFYTIRLENQVLQSGRVVIN